MYKKVIYRLFPFIIFLALTYLYLDEREIKVEQESSKIEDEDLPVAADSEEVYIDKVFSLAKQGMIKDISVIAGKSKYEEVEKMYGEPERIDETSVGDYASYQNPEISIGYLNSIAFDLRSYEDDLQDTRYLDILDQLGEPDDIKYYKDANYDQIIFIYDVSANYQLKWVLTKPNSSEQNPNVHHLSVVAMDLPEQTESSSSLAISQLLDRMSIDEKLGQMIFAGISGTELNREAENLIRVY